MARIAPLVEIGQAELQMRGNRALRDAIDVFRDSSEDASKALNRAIDQLRISSEAAAKRLLRPTRILVGLTVVLLCATIALFVTAV